MVAKKKYSPNSIAPKLTLIKNRSPKLIMEIVNKAKKKFKANEYILFGTSTILYSKCIRLNVKYD